MTRLQKKCFLFSAGMHGLLLVILLGSSAFSDKPPAQEMTILTMIPANILDKAGVGGGSPAPAAPQPAPQPAQPAVQTPTPPVQTPKPVTPRQPIEPVERPRPREVQREPAPKPQQIAKEPTEKPVHEREHHDIVPDFTPASSVSHNKTKTKTSDTETSESSARADARRRRQMAEALDQLANSVKTSGAKGTAVEVPGQGGGEAFADYKTVIYNYYYHAWITPDSVANKLAATDVKIVVGRDGTILSAEVVNKSGERALDTSVEKALRDVRRLPPFPAASHDEQRSFLIRFNLESKEASG